MNLNRCAIVGFGRLASGLGKDQSHFPKIWRPNSLFGAISQISNASLVAVCDLDIRLMDQLPLNIKRYTDYRDLLRNEKLDFLAVATRAPIRLEVASAAIRSGCRKLHLEKPLSTNIRELENFENLLNESKTMFSYGAIRRVLEPYRMVKKIIDSKIHGSLIEIRVNYGISNLFWSHSHSIDLLLFYINHDSERIKISGKLGDSLVFVEGQKLVMKSDPLVLDLLLEFSNGQIATFTRKDDSSVDLFLDEGVLSILENGRRVIFDSFSVAQNQKHVYWDEDNSLGIGGFTAPLTHLINPEDFISHDLIDLRKNMLDAINGQKILFQIAEELVVSKSPVFLGSGFTDLIFQGLGPNDLPA